jgi:hypothetical protein
MAKHFCTLNLLQKCIILSLLCFVTNVYSQPSWQLYESKQGVSVYFQRLSDDTLKMKAETVVENTTAEDLIALLSDTDAAPRWIENIAKVKLLKYLSPSENLVYSFIDSHWPVANRDLVTYSCYTKRSALQTQLSIHARPDFLPQTKGVVRISTLNATWLLTQQANNLHIDYQVYALPGGSIPNWLNNRVALKSTFNTLINLAEILTTKQYTAKPTVIRTGNCTHGELPRL